MYLINALKTSSKETWIETFLWMGYTLGVSLVPVWGGFVLLNLWGKWQDLFTFFIHGELALYSASLLASAFYTLDKIKKRGLLFFAWVLLFISLILFTGVTASSIQIQPNIFIPINRNFLIKISIPTYILSIFITFIAVFLENACVKSESSIESIKTHEMHDFVEKFNKLNRGM